MQQLLFAGLGGFVGSALRYWISNSVYRVAGQDFPYGTLVVNIAGSLLIGFFAAFFEDRFVGNPDLRIFLIIGILGGFTTFSSFSYETIALLQERSFGMASANILFSVFTCLFATWLGNTIGKWMGGM